MNSMTPLAIFGMGTMEMVVIAVLILVLFGSRLPGAMKSLGASIREFKKGVKEGSGSPEDTPDRRITEERDRTADEYTKERQKDRESDRRS